MMTKHQRGNAKYAERLRTEGFHEGVEAVRAKIKALHSESASPSWNDAIDTAEMELDGIARLSRAEGQS